MLDLILLKLDEDLNQANSFLEEKDGGSSSSEEPGESVSACRSIKSHPKSVDFSQEKYVSIKKEDADLIKNLIDKIRINPRIKDVLDEPESIKKEPNSQFNYSKTKILSEKSSQTEFCVIIMFIKILELATKPAESIYYVMYFLQVETIGRHLLSQMLVFIFNKKN